MKKNFMHYYADWRKYDTQDRKESDPIIPPEWWITINWWHDNSIFPFDDDESLSSEYLMKLAELKKKDYRLSLVIEIVFIRMIVYYFVDDEVFHSRFMTEDDQILAELFEDAESIYMDMTA